MPSKTTIEEKRKRLKERREAIERQEKVLDARETYQKAVAAVKKKKD